MHRKAVSSYLPHSTRKYLKSSVSSRESAPLSQSRFMQDLPSLLDILGGERRHVKAITISSNAEFQSLSSYRSPSLSWET